MSKTPSKPNKTPRKAAKSATKGSTPTTMPINVADMSYDDLKEAAHDTLHEFTKRARVMEAAEKDAKAERIAALRAELAELTGGPIVLASDPRPDEAPEPERDPEPDLKDIGGVPVQSQDKLFIRQALVAAACLVERGIIHISDPTYYVDGIQDMCAAAQVISRAMWAAHNSTGDLIWMADELAAPDPFKAASDED